MKLKCLNEVLRAEYQYKTDGAAGLDLIAAIPGRIELFPGRTALVPTGLCAEIPHGYAALVCPRSGLASNNQITVLNGPGVVDSDYRGEIKVLLVNHGLNIYEIYPGARIAQLVVVASPRMSIEWVSELDETARGSGGFGSTGGF